MPDALITPAGPYRLRLMVSEGRWTAALPHRRGASAVQLPDGRVVVSAASDDDVALARFMLALDDDTTEFHELFADDPLLGATSRALVGYRPLRVATVAHAVVKGFCGQLVQSSRAREIERSVLRACGEAVATQEALRRLSPAMLRRCGLAASRSTALARLCGSIDLERLRTYPTPVVRARLERERGIGPWTLGVISMKGLGRYDHGIVGDLGLVKLASSLAGRWVAPADTATLLAPYGRWQGLAAELLLLGWKRGLIPGSSRDAVRALPRNASHSA
jgi:3-methyladenine DNA glycosylase/8-oxoguanine DNA glycosylase